MSVNGQAQYINHQLNISHISIGHEVVYAQNGSWIVASESDYKLKFFKINDFGKVIWNKVIDISNTERYTVSKGIKKSNGHYVFAGIAQSTCDILIYIMFVVELSGDGEVIMKVEYPVTYSYPVFVFEDLYQDLIVVNGSKI